FDNGLNSSNLILASIYKDALNLTTAPTSFTETFDQLKVNVELFSTFTTNSYQSFRSDNYNFNVTLNLDINPNTESISSSSSSDTNYLMTGTLIGFGVVILFVSIKNTKRTGK
ncbi:MAG: hypothetical protein ACXAC2_11400, partial [Candidatus Kariarchaeaceae archaeon]